MRRLKEEDIRQLRERQVRLESDRKLQIVSKDKEQTQFLNLVKQSEQLILKKIQQHQIKNY